MNASISLAIATRLHRADRSRYDLRTQLTAIRGHAQLAQRLLDRAGLIDEPRLRAHLAAIDAAVERMDRQIERLQVVDDAA
ncbi:MAG TPA: histidine kinase dimerization/phospho-acceptor domain-containing protein [Thermomicrobiales bacterium]|nr:histidine kinase dimerization/phospho-acceptor domain-containing protein [Thermomicrobiales bacterium]